MNRYLPITAAAVMLLSASAYGRTISDYIDWGPTSHQFPAALKAWQPGTQMSPDDNFFISRVRPRARFVNTATQVNPALTPEVDKKLIYWVPIGTPPHNALPSDQFDSDVFSMWSYVTHFGNWSTPMARIPGNFSDAAHRNGVGVSPVLGIPWGYLTADWGITLRDMLAVGPEKMADFLAYYGIDGLGYNSEFSIYNNVPADEKPGSVSEISDFNAAITRISKQKGNDAFMNIWYDGTATDGNILFDRGLSEHNYDTFGRGENIASSLFFNYNWNNEGLMTYSVDNARSIGRDPLDLYVGFNMQGGQPSKSSKSWSLLKNYPLSIGLWGAHSESMMYESRRELGTSPAAIQANYLLRTEWWFSGGTRNPANAPEITDTWNYSGYNTGFFGMARLMSARSSLTEPFVTNFNLGNGTFFNYKGQRQSNIAWANIGIQDILPTWRFWWSSSLLGGQPEDVPAGALDATFVWDDAWLGGSSLRISGSITEPEYLHLFKTSIPMQADDKIFVRFKQIEGKAAMHLVLTAEGAENVEIALPAAIEVKHFPSQDWREISFNISEAAPQLVGKKIALVAMKFDSASKLDMRLGGFGILRGESAKPATPLLTHTELLYASATGVDGKIIWDMPSSDTKRYNDDHGVSFFQLYSQQEGYEPVMQSGTSSWAGLLLNAPVNAGGSNRVRFGVAAVSSDFGTPGEIAWGEWHNIDERYELSHAVTASKSEVYPGTPVVFSFVDPQHPAAEFTLTHSDGTVAHADPSATGIEFTPTKSGSYSLTVKHAGENGELNTDTYENLLHVLAAETAGAPEITDFNWEAESDDTLAFTYEGKPGEGKRSRAMQLSGNPFGMAISEVALTRRKDFSVAFWLCPNEYTNDETHLVSLRDKTDSWSKNEWGWLWSTIGKNGKGIKIDIRRLGDRGSTTFYFPEVFIAPGIWTHIGFSFDFNESNMLEFGLFINGKEVPCAYYEDENGQRFDGAPEPMNQLYQWRTGNIISVGGTLFKAGGVEGAIDNFTFWRAPLTEGRAEIAAGTIDPAQAPEGLCTFYSFEKDATDDGYFVNEIATSDYPEAKAGRFRYVPQVIEGSGLMQFIKPDFCGGAPQIAGNEHMKTQVKWIAPGAMTVAPQGDANAGSAKLTYAAGGNYKVTLRLENACGADEREVNMIYVPGSAAVEAIEAGAPLTQARVMIAPRGALALNFGAPGNYTVEVLTLDGRPVASKKVTTTAAAPHMISDLPASTPLLVRVHK